MSKLLGTCQDCEGVFGMDRDRDAVFYDLCSDCAAPLCKYVTPARMGWQDGGSPEEVCGGFCCTNPRHRYREAE